MGIGEAARRISRHRLQGGAKFRPELGGGVPLRHGKTFQQVLPKLPDFERGNKAACARPPCARAKHARRDERRDGFGARAVLGEDVGAKREAQLIVCGE